MKKVILSAVAVLAFCFTNAQEKGKFRVGLDFGYTIPSGGGGGVLFSIEPKYNIADNMNVGFRFGSAAMAKNIISTSGSEVEGKLAANGSYLATYDYYFKGSSSFTPYVGAGAGIFTLANVEYSSSSTVISTIDAKSKFGGLIRTGFEWGKFRMGLEYNLVPKSNLNNLSGTTIGTTKNSYLGIHLGFYLGGGTWGKK